MSEINVWVEINDGAIHDVSLQCLAVARTLAGASGRVRCLVTGAGVNEAAARLFARGADEVFAADDARLAAYLTSPYRTVVGGWLGATPAKLTLMAASTIGNDLAPALAASLDAACVLDGDEVAADNGGFVVRRAGYDRKVRTTFSAASDRPLIVTLRDGAAEAPAETAGRTGAVQAVPVALDDADQVAKVLRRDVAKKTVNLKDAKIIVAAGAGVGGPEGLAAVKQLAEALGAEVGATRAVVDANWLPADHQIGQTGSTVRPAVYIACGISGAVQHRVGMMDAGKIVAINTDANAPIFKIAHYKLVGDLKVIVPKLVKLIPG